MNFYVELCFPNGDRKGQLQKFYKKEDNSKFKIGFIYSN